MSAEVRISVVIPTRSRARYLQGCLQSVLIAADLAGCPVEIIVSDNASTDDTEAVVQGFDSALITYTRQPRRVSMRQNFEDALSCVTGSHVIYIGDDDGILPNGLRLLRELLIIHDPDVVKWRKLNFKWPNDVAQVPGHLVIRYMKLSGRISWLDHTKLQNLFFQGKHRDYSDGAGIYHGCISRRLIERVKSTSKGTYFWCSMPDVYTSVANLLALDRDILKIDRPISLAGASPRSTGDSAVQMSKAGANGQETEMEKFIREAENDPFRDKVSDGCMSIQLHLLAALELACRLQDIPFQINRENWVKVVHAELAGFAPDMVSPCKEGAELLLGQGAVSDTGRQMPKAKADALTQPVQSPSADMTKAAQTFSYRLTKTTISGGEHMKDIVRAAQFLDDLVDNADLENALHPPAALIGVLRMRNKLRRLNQI